MPSYDFENKETGEIEEHMMSYTKLDEFKKEFKVDEDALSLGTAIHVNTAFNALKSST